MYRGIVDNVVWERVHLTISGHLQLIETQEEIDELFKIRKPDYFDGNDNYTAQELVATYQENLDALKASIGPEYDENQLYFFWRTDGYGQFYRMYPDINSCNDFSLHINVTDFLGRKPIPDGSWEISVFHEGVDYALNISVDVVKHSFELSRPFIFNKNSQCYVVNILSSSNEFDPVFKLRSYIFKRRRKRKFDLKRIFRESRDFVIKRLIRLYYNFFYFVVPKNGKRILIATEARGRLQGNLEAINNGLKSRGLDKHFKIYTSFRRAAGGNASAWSWFKLITYVSICDKILIDDYAPFLNWLKLRKGTEVIQVWHAGVGFKSVGFCRFGANGSPVIDTGHRQYTYAITGSTNLKHVYSEVFGIEESAVIPTGLPRIDELLDKDKHTAFVKDFFIEYPQFKNKKLILFAPTFRGMGQKDANYPYELLDLKRIYDFCGDEYVFLFKMHPFIIEQPPIPKKYNDRIVNFSSYPDVNELLRVTDLMITDYSSIIYEYSLFNKPIIFFAYDKDTYSVVRGFHNDYDNFAPGKICTSFDELEQAILKKDFEIDKVSKFVSDNFDYLDTGSTDRFIDWILLETKPEILNK